METEQSARVKTAAEAQGISVEVVILDAAVPAAKVEDSVQGAEELHRNRSEQQKPLQRKRPEPQKNLMGCGPQPEENDPQIAQQAERRRISDAAQRLGVHTSQIVNAWVFELKAKGGNGVRKPILVCAPGDRKIDGMKIASALGVSKNRLKPASASSVLAITGFEVGGVAPCGWNVPPFAVLIEERCFDQETVWCGAGIKPAMFSCSPEQLLCISGGKRISLSPHVWPG